MKKIAVLTIFASAILVMGSCGNKTQKVPFDNGDSVENSKIDPTVYGICGDAATDNRPG